MPGKPCLPGTKSGSVDAGGHLEQVGAGAEGPPVAGEHARRRRRSSAAASISASVDGVVERLVEGVERLGRSRVSSRTRPVSSTRSMRRALQTGGYRFQPALARRRGHYGRTMTPPIAGRSPPASSRSTRVPSRCCWPTVGRRHRQGPRRLGFQALATTSAGLAATLGRPDGNVTRDEAIAHAAALVGGHRPAGERRPRERLRRHARGRGRDGPPGGRGRPGRLLDRGLRPAPSRSTTPGLAAERVAAAVEAAHGGPASCSPPGPRTTSTASHDLDDTIARLQSYQEAGADVLYAPASSTADDIRRRGRVGRPPGQRARPAGRPAGRRAGRLGVGRISVGGGFALVAYGALVEAGRELLDQGTYGWWATAAHTAALGDAFD